MGTGFRVFVGEAVRTEVRVFVGVKAGMDVLVLVGTVPDLLKVLDHTGAEVPTL